MNGSAPERSGFIPRLEAARGSEVDVRLGPPALAAALRTTASATGERVHLRLPDGGTEIVGEASDLYGAFCHARAQLRERERWVCACGNCESFVFSQMSYQMSSGQKGYCTLGKEHPNNAGGDDIVSILDVCDAFRYGPGARDHESGP